MKVTQLRIDSGADGCSTVTVWADCHSAEDIDDLIRWLCLAGRLTKQWQQYRKTKRATNVARITDASRA